ncbi:MAG: hypothetical protein PW843_26765 [Azospirillaceae bacterium]|nr:hypothetical protein [Azospirillaceae bacterium]
MVKAIHKIFRDPNKFRRRAGLTALVFALGAPVAGYNFGIIVGGMLTVLAFLVTLLIVVFDMCSSSKSCSCPVCSYRTVRETGLWMKPPPEEHCTGLRARLFGMT